MNRNAYSILIFLLILISSYLNGQDLMTIGEVFDFEIGDSFHYEGHHPEQPPNADRITITNKYYSPNGDTLYYQRYHNSYYTYVEWTPNPHLEWVFWTKTDTVYYTYPDSSITTYWPDYDTSFYSYDTIIYFSSDHCDSLVNGYNISTSSFEPDFYHYEYGKGIGWIKQYYGSSQSIPHFTIWDNELFYYQKNGIGCGIPDTITVGIPNQSFQTNNFMIYPNPAGDIIHIAIEQNLSVDAIRIYNQLGQMIMVQEEFSGSVDISTLPQGLYIVEVISNATSIKKKIIVR